MSKKRSHSNQSANSAFAMIMILIVVLAGGFLLIIGSTNAAPTVAGVEAKLVNGKQVVAVDVKDSGYSPSVVTVKSGTPVEMTFNGKSYGCSSTLVSRDFWSGVKYVAYGKQEVIAFTPNKTGRFKYSCSMGMYVGYINVI